MSTPAKAHTGTCTPVRASAQTMEYRAGENTPAQQRTHTYTDLYICTFNSHFVAESAHEMVCQVRY